MKQYTTPLLSWTLDGYGDVVKGADAVVVNVKNDRTKYTASWTKNQITIDDDTFSIRINAEDTTDMLGDNRFEMFWRIGDLIYSTVIGTFYMEKSLSNPIDLLFQAEEPLNEQY